MILAQAAAGVLLMAAWLTEAHHLFPQQPAPGCPRPRLLELGAGLGIVGLAAAMAFPALRVTMSDYDPAVLDNLRQTIELNRAHSPQAAAALDVAAVDPAGDWRHANTQPVRRST